MTIGMRRGAVRAVGLATGAAALAGLGGCESDSFLDPSTIGRWERTPTVMPILDRLSAIEDVPSDIVQAEPVQPQDLIPEIEQYRFGPGDVVEVAIRDFVAPGAEDRFQVTVDSRGYIFIPNLPPIRAGRLTNEELAQAIRVAIRDAGIRADLDAVVSVNILSQRSQTFSAIGAVAAQQEYFIPKPDYRLLDALATTGGFNETIEKIYIIRQVALSEEAAGRAPASRPQPLAPGEIRPEQPREPERPLLDLIDELSRPSQQPAPNPGELGRRQPADEPLPPPQPSGSQPPPIDLPDTGSVTPPAQPAPAPGSTGWVYRDGRWVRLGAAAPEAPAAGAPSAPLVTQRVIEVPVKRLLAGDASVNVVIRPGDVVRVPPPPTGVVYLAGQVARPGPYTLSGDTKMTLLRGLDSAGGLSSIAIPERTDLTRVVGPGRQATIRLDLRAIAEQTQPDIYLKPDDRINVGTNFWALPLAVFRGGLRASYGFGFILDRNFSGEVFGPDESLAR